MQKVNETIEAIKQTTIYKSGWMIHEENLT